MNSDSELPAAPGSGQSDAERVEPAAAPEQLDLGPGPFVSGNTDSRRVMSYLLAPEAEDYLTIMDVLDAHTNDMTVADVGHALLIAGHPLDVRVVESRLDKLRYWGAVSARTDNSKIQRYIDLLARNWRYTASHTGRQVQRFYRTVLSGTPTVREIPLTSLNRIVTTLESLAAVLDAAGPGATISADMVNDIGSVFTSHDDLDAALVGAEDALATLADRFDLSDESTNDLKGLLVDYATRVAAELDSGAARATRALDRLHLWFTQLAEAAVSLSQARALIEAGALTASRGGRRSDWEGLVAWFDPHSGRAARFSLRLVRSLPGMHANLRRLHSSVGTASSRNRALALAKAVLTPDIGTQIFQAATGDHPWRKLYGESDDDESVRTPSWRGGPLVPVPTLLRSIGQAGARGRGGVPRDDSFARAEIDAARARRRSEHTAAIAVVLSSGPGEQLNDSAARVALAALMAAARSAPIGIRRTASQNGLACTLVHVGNGVGALVAPTWSVLIPDRVPLFHLPGRRPSDQALAALTSAPQPDFAPQAGLHVSSASPSGTAAKHPFGLSAPDIKLAERPHDEAEGAA
jgi:hypothetical protein